MLFLYLLSAMVFAFIMRTAYQIVRKHKRMRPQCVRLVPMKISEMSSVSGCRHLRRSEVKWISMGEFKRLLDQSEDVLFIDLRAPGRGAAPLPFSPARVLLITVSELIDVLRWTPSGNTVVLFGQDDCCRSIAEQVRDIMSGPPLYLLNDGLDAMPRGLR
jgi:hypothetical protein